MNSVDLLSEIMEEQEKENIEKKLSGLSTNGRKKNKLKTPVILLSILSAVLAASLITTLFLWWGQNQRTTQYINTLKGESESLNDELSKMEFLYDARGNLLESERKAVSEMSAENAFYNFHACIVTESGEKYHRYGCQYVENATSFWIYNIEAAEGRGYEPCSVCKPGQLVLP